MSDGRVACTACGAKLPDDFANTDDFRPCPSCNKLERVFTFPALRRPLTAAPALPAMEEGEASCFYHPHKRAVVLCESCGRFLCALCDVEIGAAHRCPACLEAGKRKGTADSLPTRTLLWDGVALVFAVVPILVWPMTLFTAPAVIFLVIKYWNRPLSVLPRTRVRLIFALLIALAQVFGWILLGYYAFASIRGRTV